MKAHNQYYAKKNEGTSSPPLKKKFKVNSLNPGEIQRQIVHSIVIRQHKIPRWVISHTALPLLDKKKKSNFLRYSLNTERIHTHISVQEPKFIYVSR